jgi:hypothetical protein
MKQYDDERPWQFMVHTTPDEAFAECPNIQLYPCECGELKVKA